LAKELRYSLIGARDMAGEPDNMVLIMLREIRAKQEDHSQVLADQTRRFDHLERRLDDLSKVVRYSLGQSAETQFRQSQQEQRIDELFAKLEDLLKPKEPA
jgi:aminoglycoside phosphotransferase